MTSAAHCRVVVNDDGCQRPHLMRAARLIRKHPDRCTLATTVRDGRLRETVATWAPAAAGSRPWAVVTIQTFADPSIERGHALSILVADLLDASVVDETTVAQFETVRSRLASIAYVATSLDDPLPRFANAFAPTPWTSAHCMRLPNRVRAVAERVEIDPAMAATIPTMVLVARTALDRDAVTVRLCEVEADRSRVAGVVQAMRHLGEAA